MRRILTGASVAALAGLIWFSIHLAIIRIYQVDECTELYNARMLALGQVAGNAGFITLFQIILSCFVHGPAAAGKLYAVARIVMVTVFWLNIVLMTLGTGEKLFSRRGLAALLGAATLAPLWDYGFEIRHDNLLLTGILLMWMLLRVRPPGLWAYFLLGAVGAALQFMAFKSFVYTIPLALAGLFFPPPDQKITRAKSVAALVVGALLAFAILRISLGAAGLWQLYLNGSQSLSNVSASGYRFSPAIALKRLLWQTPLLLVFATSGLVALAAGFQKDRRAVLNWNGNFPEAMLFLVALTALLINPVPYPYNLLHLVPFAFIFAFRHAMELWQKVRTFPALIPAGVAVVFFTHLVPYETATSRHVDWRNDRQNQLIGLAEKLTDASTGGIYDGVALVVSRPMNSQWFLHSFAFIGSSNPHIYKLLTDKPALVFIPNYRTDWLSATDHIFIRKRYVPMADDFWVMGHVLPPSGGEFQIYQKGRYRISTLKGSDIEGTYPEGLGGLINPPENGDIKGTLDGKPLLSQQVELAVGLHRFECSTNDQPAVVWLGPQLDRIGRIGAGDHHFLFVNWY